jgi:hypothetical protein
MLDWERLYSDADDFCRVFEPAWEQQQIEAGIKHRVRPSALTLSEVMAIIIAFHQSRFRDFKHFYIDFVSRYHRDAFPNLVSYSRFVELMPSALVPLCAFLHTRCGRVTGIAYIDSTRLVVCHLKRAHAHRVFRQRAKWGKTSVGWFYGFKLHLVINDEGELLAFKLTAGNVDDRVPVPVLTQGLFGKLFGDKGYISQKLFDELYEKGVELITRLRKKMKNKLMRLADKLLLRKRALIESVNDQLKNISQIEHTRHRSPANFLVNLVAGLIAYTYQPKKPSLNLRPDELAQLPVLV